MSSVSKVKYNIEFAHLYGSNLQSYSYLKENVYRTLQIVNQTTQNNFPFSLSVLIDDYSMDTNHISPKELNELLTDFGLPPDYIVMESQMTKYADHFLKYLPKKYVVEKDSQFVFHSFGNDLNLYESPPPARRYKSIFMEKVLDKPINKKKQIPKQTTTLKQERCHSDSAVVLAHTIDSVKRYSCPLLTACWYLCRLGVSGFMPEFAYVRKGAPPFVAERLITVLSTDFLKVESTAFELLGLSKTKTFKKRRKQVEYYFY